MARQEDEALDRLLTRTLQSQRAATGDVCPSAEDVAAYLDRSLDAEETRRIELHLSSCARCAETLATLVETEPVLSPAASPSPSWWTWSVWRWAAPAAAVVVIGVWFASTLPGGPEPATQMAQYDQTKEQTKEQSNQEAAAPSRAAGEPAAADPAAAEKSATGSVAVDKLSRRREAVTTPPRETEQRTVDNTESSSTSAARATAEADSAPPRDSTPAQPSPQAPRAQAKAEDSRPDAAPVETRRQGREGAIAGFAAPAAQPASPGAPPPSPPAPPPAAPEAATAAATAAPPAGGAARAAGGAGGRAAGREAPAPPATLSQTTETQERAATVAGFAPLVLRMRSSNALWRVAGSVIERSADGGTTWTQDYRASGTISAGVIAGDDTIWLAGNAGLILRRPPNGGWQVVPPPVMEDLTGASEPGTTSITVRTASGRQYRTTNNGATWMAR